VIFIQKSIAPRVFLDWVNLSGPEWTAEWVDMPSDVKSSLLSALLSDQGYICCYCGMRIDDKSSHVEHIRPRHWYPEYSLNYNNLLASCGRRYTANQPLHCGAAKGDWFDEVLLVSPLYKDRIMKFTFFANGIVAAIDEDLPAVTTIKKLNLNSPNLQEHRRKAVDAVVELLSEYTIDEIVHKIIQRDADGRLEPFCFVITNVLSGLR